MDCLALGSATFDVLMQVDQVPSRNNRVKALAVAAGGGGPAATAAVAMSKLGLNVGIISAVGNDVFADLIVDELRGHDVDVAGIQRVSGTSTITSVLIEKNGYRSMATYDGCINRIDLKNVDFSLIRHSKSVHMDANNVDLAIAAAKAAKQCGVLVSLDGGNISPKDFARLLPLVDIYIPDESSMRTQLGHDISPEEGCRLYAEMGPATVCVTLGEHGSVSLQGGKIYKEAAFADMTVIDTTGAGDNFHGAFVAAHLAGMDLPTTLRFASIQAALSCRAIGGRSASPDADELARYIPEMKSFQMSFGSRAGNRHVSDRP